MFHPVKIVAFLFENEHISRRLRVQYDKHKQRDSKTLPRSSILCRKELALLCSLDDQKWWYELGLARLEKILISLVAG